MEFNDGNLKKLRWLIVFTVAAVVVGVNYQRVFLLAGRIFGILFPFLLGGAMAFILNVPMRRIEKLLPMKEGNRLRRPFSLVLTLVFVAGILLLVTLVVAPQLVETVSSLQYSIPAFASKVQKWLEQLLAAYPGSMNLDDYIGSIQINWAQVYENVFNFLRAGAGSVLSSTVSAALSIVSGVATFGIGLIFSIYVLLQKETLGRQLKKLMYAFLPERATTTALAVLGLAQRTFSSFLTGQCVEAVILGTMFFVTLSVFQMPYALLIGVLIAFTALIPVFGAFIGCGVGIFLMLMISPMKALVFILIFNVLQQIEGNLIYPRVVGNSVGLPSIWVLVAVTIGGSAMGITGMLIFIPLCSVVYTLLRGAVNKRLEVKKPSS